MSNDVCTAVMLVFIATIPARTPYVPEFYNGAVFRTAPIQPQPYWFTAPNTVRLISIPAGQIEVAHNRKDEKNRPAWGCLWALSLFCLYAELNQAVLAARIWHRYVLSMPLVVITALCSVIWIFNRNKLFEAIQIGLIILLAFIALALGPIIVGIVH